MIYKNTMVEFIYQFQLYFSKMQILCWIILVSPENSNYIEIISIKKLAVLTKLSMYELIFK